MRGQVLRPAQLAALETPYAPRSSSGHGATAITEYLRAKTISVNPTQELPDSILDGAQLAPAPV